MIHGDASEFYRLSNDLAQVGARAVMPMRGVILEGGKALRDEWRANARETAGRAAAKYPDTIEAGLAFGVSSIAVDVSPEGGGQAKLGSILEFGSHHSPPHLDGLRALETVAPRVERMVDAALGYLFP